MKDGDYLMECGYEVAEAIDGQEAWASFSEAPDLVFISSPISMVGSAQDHRKTSSPCLMLTARED